MKQFKSLIPLELRMKLVNSLLIPYIDYCSLVFSDLTGELLNKLQTMLNSGIRYIYNINIYDHVTPYYVKLNWLKLKHRRIYQQSIFMYKILSCKAPDYLYENVIANLSDVLNRPVRVRKQFKVPKCRTTVYQLSTINSCIRVWNDIPDFILNAKNLNQFKLKMFAYLINECYGD